MTEEQKNELNGRLNTFYQGLMDKIDSKSQQTNTILESITTGKTPDKDELEELMKINQELIVLYQSELQKLEEIFKKKKNYEFFKRLTDTKIIDGEYRDVIWYKENVNAQITEAEPFVRPSQSIISITKHKDVFVPEAELDYYNTLAQEMDRLAKENTMLNDYGRMLFTSPKIDNTLDEQTQKALETLWRKERPHVSDSQLVRMLNNSLQNRVTKKLKEKIEKEIQELKALEQSYLQQIENINEKFTADKLEKLQNVIYQNWVIIREHNSAILRSKGKMSHSEYTASQNSAQIEEMEKTTKALFPVLHSLEKLFYMLKNKESIPTILNEFEKLNLNLKQATKEITHERTLSLLNGLEENLKQYLTTDLNLLEQKQQLNSLEESLKDNRTKSSALFSKLSNLKSKDKYEERRNQFQAKQEAKEEQIKKERREANEERREANQAKKHDEQAKEDEQILGAPDPKIQPIKNVAQSKNKFNLKKRIKQAVAAVLAAVALYTGLSFLKPKQPTPPVLPTEPTIADVMETIPSQKPIEEIITTNPIEEVEQEEIQEQVAGLGDVVTIGENIYKDIYSAMNKENAQKPYYEADKEYTIAKITLTNGTEIKTVYANKEGKELYDALLEQGYTPMAYGITTRTPDEVELMSSRQIDENITGYENQEGINLGDTILKGRGI